MATVPDLAWAGGLPGDNLPLIDSVDPSLAAAVIGSESGYIEPKINHGAAGDGVTDDSAAVNEAVAAAIAAGDRFIAIDYDYYVPTLDKAIGDLIAVGLGSLIGAPVRKEVIPPYAQTAPMPSATLRFSKNCPTAAAAAATGTVRIVLTGDSVSTSTVNGQSMFATFNAKLHEAFIRDNPGVTIEWYNRGIGGENWEGLNGVATNTASVPWYLNPAEDWLTYIEALTPDVLIVSCARNGAGAFQLKHIRDVLAKTATWTPVPDLIFTNSVGETQTESSDLVTAAAQRNSYEFAAEGIRSYALANGIGLIDTETRESYVRFGYAQETLPLITDASALSPPGTDGAVYRFDLPYTFPIEVYGYGGRFRMSAGDWTILGNEISFRIGAAQTSGAEGCRFWIKRDPGTFEISWRITASLVSEGGSEDYVFIDWTATGVTSDDTQLFAFTLAQQGSRVYAGYLLSAASFATPETIANSYEVMFHGYVPRCGGLYIPDIKCAAGTTVGGLRLLTGANNRPGIATARPIREALYMPELIDNEFAAPSDGSELWGGGGPHPSSLAAELIVQQTINVNDFSFEPEPSTSLGIRSSFTSYYTSPCVVIFTTAAAVVADVLYAQPIRLPGSTIDRIGINVTAGAAGLCRLGLYTNKGTGADAGMPDQLLVDCGTVDTTSIAFVEASFPALTLSNRYVWMVAVFNATPTCTIGTAAGSNILGGTATSAYRAIRAAFTYDVLPTTAPTMTAFITQAPILYVRKS